jgi:hypothetical protein
MQIGVSGCDVVALSPLSQGSSVSGPARMWSCKLGPGMFVVASLSYARVNTF